MKSQAPEEITRTKIMCKSHAQAQAILPNVIFTLNHEQITALRTLIPAGAFECSQVEAPLHKITVLLGEYAGPVATEISKVPSEMISMKCLAEICVKLIPGFQPAPLYLSAPAQDFIRVVKWLRGYCEGRICNSGALLHGIESVPIYEAGGLQAWGSFGGGAVMCELFTHAPLVEWWERIVVSGYAMAAVAPRDIKEVVLAFPLHGFAHSLHVGGWADRDTFLHVLLEFLAGDSREDMEDDEESGPEAPASADELMNRYGIGRHLSKAGAFSESLKVVTDGSRAWQYFLSPPRMTRVSVKQEDIAASRAYIERTRARIFIHSPYIINLSQPPGKDNYGVTCLRETLVAASAMGCQGVVVHVGKAVKLEVGEALANMRENILACLDVATVDCPLLLETPAGQGTETLLTYAEFFGFVAEIGDPRLRVCVDTCHVFASGQCPLAYLERAVREYPGWVRLIHFNDSLGACGSCVDRHALPGAGHIGLAKMTALAEVGLRAGIGMVYE